MTYLKYVLAAGVALAVVEAANSDLQKESAAPSFNAVAMTIPEELARKFPFHIGDFIEFVNNKGMYQEGGGQLAATMYGSALSHNIRQRMIDAHFERPNDRIVGEVICEDFLALRDSTRTTLTEQNDDGSATVYSVDVYGRRRKVEAFYPYIIEEQGKGQEKGDTFFANEFTDDDQMQPQLELPPDDNSHSLFFV